ncbi:complex I NDUFA9 subunit family protein [Rhodobacter sp. TJ_12]|uniref:complex I NDUFA9 subunit family protein n=1 Tax=Rhodobacter sp. TJ_12 TaxID=2029399 RepID=UPI001CBB5934|nr:complex I NDUFA9 subunit family protein [Rhodobacter sp. TJ_12]MBZ4023576.1 complex I NDUFA9 subunit family protein [Rhodobacter sp. TJ_12]
MSKLVTIYGGSGFVGRYIARRMAKEGWRVRVAVRRPNEALFVRPYGAVGQVEPFFCNVRDSNSVRAAMQGADAVVNCVGILVNEGKNTFSAVQAEGAERIATLAAETGVERLVHISAIGADNESDSKYSRTKGWGELAVRKAFPTAVILRPSVIFGPEDDFFNRFAAMTKLSPVLPITAGETKFQPVYVDDVAKVAVMGVLGQAEGTYELGGPDVESFEKLMKRMLAVVGRKNMIVNLPGSVSKAVAIAGDTVQWLTGGLITNRILTSDQLKNLYRNNLVAKDARGFADLGLSPTPMGAVLPDYLWRFRPHGQYEAIQASAKNLRKHG